MINMEHFLKSELNELGQPVGLQVPGWQGAKLPDKITLHGNYCRLEPLDPEKHAQDLFEANSLDQAGRIWTYLPYGPFTDFESYVTWLEKTCLGDDPLFYAIIDTRLEKATGVASYLRIEPAYGSIEVGHLCYSPLLSKTIAATEAMYLMMQNSFAAGYRRYEWKCNALNFPSRTAALRLGFSFEGIFRNSVVIKGRNRDTAWYSVIDTEWPVLQQAFQTWLSPDNFDNNDKQKISLSNLTKPLLASSDKQE